MMLDIIPVVKGFFGKKSNQDQLFWHLVNSTLARFEPTIFRSKLNVVVKSLSDRIQTLSVEFFHLDEMGNSNDELKSYMEKQVSIE
jgi:hypothetical protein